MKFISNEVGCYPSGELFEVTEMTEEWYWNFNGCVPPINVRHGDFMVGEPVSHVEYLGVFVPTYRLCWEACDRFFSAQVPMNYTLVDWSCMYNESLNA